MKEIKNILIVGVGGQGVLLASELLSEAALEAGFDVKKSEVHGMAQRGGAVSSHVRIGKKVFSPLIHLGQADVLLAFEHAEAQRWAHYLKRSGSMIINDLKWVPPIALLKGFSYPDNPVESIKRRFDNVQIIGADAIAKKLGNYRVANMVLIGAVSNSLDISESFWKKVIQARVPKGTEEINLKAFQAGRENR